MRRDYKAVLHIAAGLLLLNTAWAPAHAMADTIAPGNDPYGCAEGPVTVGLAEVGVLNKAGTGIDHDLLELIAAETGCRFDKRSISRIESFSAVVAGRLDMAVASGRTRERERLAWFIPYLSVKFKMLVNRDTVRNATSLSAMKHRPRLRISRAAGAGHGPYYQRHLDDFAALGMVVLYPSMDAAANALKAGEVDATVSVPLAFRAHLSPSETDRRFSILDLDPSAGVSGDLMLGKHRFSAAQSNNWLRLIERVRLDGRFLSILRRYLPENEAKSVAEFRAY